MAIKHFFDSLGLEKEKKFLRTPVGIFLFGTFLGTLSPSPADAVHFWLQNHILNDPNFSHVIKVLIQVADWYFLDSAYYLILIIVAYSFHINKVSTIKRATWFGSIIGVGVVIGVLAQLFLR